LTSPHPKGVVAVERAGGLVVLVDHCPEAS
jgi:hypothetical protein